ncbi:MAG: DMT family transporter [Eubacterium sp.]
MAQLQNKMAESKAEKLLKKPVIVCFIAMVCCALWGSAFPFIKIGYELFDIGSDDTASQILFAGIRFTLAGILVIVFGSIISKKALYPKRENISCVCALALFQTILQYLFFYIGLAHTTGTKGSVINSTSGFFAVLVSCIILKQERLNLQKIIGCIVGFAGTVIINLSGGNFDKDMSFLGEGFILLSAISYAVSSALIKRFSQRENTVTLSGSQFIFGGLVMTVLGLAVGGGLNGTDIKGILLLIYLAFLSAAAYTLWGILLKYNDVSRVAVFGFMTPVFGCIFSALFLGERTAEYGIKTLFALLFVSAGIIIVNYNNKRKGDKND